MEFFFDEGFYGVGFGDNDAAFYTVRKQLWFGFVTILTLRLFLFAR